MKNSLDTPYTFPIYSKIMATKRVVLKYGKGMGMALKQLREAQRMTQLELSRITGIPQPNISLMEGGGPCGFQSAERIARALGFEIEMVVEFSAPKKIIEKSS